MAQTKVLIKQIENSALPNQVFITDIVGNPTYSPLNNLKTIILPTPKVFIPYNGKQNISNGNDVSVPLAVDPNNANKPIFLKLYYEGSDNVNEPWMQMPDLRYELLRKKPYNGNSNHNSKGRSGSAWVHPSHRNGADRLGSSYSGGEQKDVSGNAIPNRDTEWVVLTTTNKSGAQLKGFNPFTEVEVDPKLWFVGNNPIGSNILPLRYVEYIDSCRLISSKRGYSTGIQNFRFRFRMSCGDPSSFNGSVYKRRLYSDHSEVFEIYPHGGNFKYTGTEVIDRVLYEWRVRPI